MASATPAVGDSYLLPAFAAVFVGATQFKAKRFNVVGTIIAAFMLGHGSIRARSSPEHRNGRRTCSRASLSSPPSASPTCTTRTGPAGGRRSKQSPDEAPVVGHDSEVASAERHILTPVPE